MGTGSGPVFFMGRRLNMMYLRPRILVFFTAVGLCLSAPLFSQSVEHTEAEKPLARPQRTQTAFRQDSEKPLPIHQGLHDKALSINGENSSLYQHYIEHYSSNAGKLWLKAVIERSEPWMGHIRQAVAHYNMPPELAWLPVIESSCTAKAISKSGAVGLWQFMKNSIAPFGISTTEWLDERRDFWKATDGALRKLNENYVDLGDWQLALAAYNAGLGAVRRAVASAKTKDYQQLCDRGFLKKETIHYVPKFRAISHILSNTQTYGLDFGWPESPVWQRISPGRSVDLGLLAQTAGLDKKYLEWGNMELTWGVSPPDKSYQLKVRSEDYEKAKAALERKDVQLVHYYIHLIRSGDTLSALSRHYGISVAAIEQSNPGIQARFLKLGQKVLVPALKEVGPYSRTAQAQMAIRFNGNYTIKKGDSLWSIALAHGVDPELLASENKIELSSIIREGQQLKTPILEVQ